MTRRARVVLGVAVVLFTVFALAVGGVVAVSRTAYGRAQVRRLVVSALSQGVHGSVYVGNITDGFFTGVSIDSLEIRDPDDSLFVRTGPVTLRYDLRDVLDQRLLLHGVHIMRPVLYLRQHSDGMWNFRAVFHSSSPPSTGPHTPGFGDYIVLDSSTIEDASVMLTMPWHPSQALHGAALDSAVRFELARKDHEIRRARSGDSAGFTRTWRWTGAHVSLVHARIADPDSTGMAFRFANVRVNEADPPFLFRNVSGTMRKLGDSVWIDVPHFDLPGSTGKGGGKVVWGSDLPVRYAVHVVGDSVSLRDVAWVYPTLPQTGGGRLDLDIRNDPTNLHLLDYILTNMDVRSTRSHLTGRMTFRLGSDTLIVRDVQMAAAPLNFDLIRTLNGKPFPYDWQGDITGTVRASGGNLTRFKVEDSRFSFADANVPGAVTRATAQGELNILYPAFTAFHALAVNIETLDLRTLQYLNKNFPRLNGTISGSTTLDSSWLDVRFRDANLLHTDGPGASSRVTGNGRVTWGAKYLVYDLDLHADSVAFGTLARSYAVIPFRGMFAGPVRVLGESPDLAVSTTLSGPGGTMSYMGRVDADPLEYGAHGSGNLHAVDVSRLFDLPKVPHTSLNGMYTVGVIGDTLPHMYGPASITLAASTIGETQLAPSSVALRLDSGIVHVDSLHVQTSGVSVDARGSVALVAERTGTLQYTATIDSMASLMRLAAVKTRTPVAGSAVVKGTLSGTPSLLRVRGDIEARSLAYGVGQVRHVAGTLELNDVTHVPTGSVALVGDSVVAGSVPFDTVRTAIQITGLRAASFRAEVGGAGSIHGVTLGRVEIGDVATQLHVDSASISVDSANVYTLAAPVNIVADARGVSVDSVLFGRGVGGSGETVALRNVVIGEDSIQASLRTSGFSLGLLALLSRDVRNLGGTLTAAVDVAGSSTHPRLSGSLGIANGTATLVPTGTRLEHITADIALAGDTVQVRTLSAETDADQRGRLTVDGTIAFNRYDDPVFALRAHARAFHIIDRRDLASLDISTRVPLTLTGPLSAPVVEGGISVDRGSIYIPELVNKRVVNLDASDLVGLSDTVAADRPANAVRAPSAVLKNLRLENVNVNIGDDVWLRSAEANIKLGGSLAVTLGSVGRTGVPSLALDGTLNASRGSYRLNVVPLIQPVFDIESGTLRFYGTSDLNPALNITAINTVRRPRESVNRQDVRIRATIGGTLLVPTLTLSSADNLPLTQSDLLSYLITGEPAFALDYTARQYVDQLAAVAIRSAGSVISSAIPRGVFDVVELQTPGAVGSDQSRIDSPTLYNLLNTRAVLGKQLNNRLFLNFSTGFCAANFRSNLGLRLEYRLSPAYTALFGLEPASSDLICARAGTTPNNPQTPPQLGVDLFRAWRF